MNRPPQHPRRRQRRAKRPAPPGTLPGTVVAHPEATESVVRCLRYSSKAYEQTNLQSAIDAVKGTPESVSKQVTWIDVGGLRDVALIQRIAKCFGLHALALEDVVNVHQRPKLDVYPDHLFVIARVHLPGSIESEQVAFFVGKGFVVTFQESNEDCLAVVRKRIELDQGRIRKSGSDYLLYSLIDLVVDGYFPALEEFGERLDVLDERVSGSDASNLIHEIHSVRTELLSIRRNIWPMRETINSLIRDSGDLVSDEVDLYFRDCYDHTVQIIDVIETDRELCADLRDFYLTVASNRMNQVMKFLTIIATLFIPLSFIAGLYGMNFNTNASSWNMPELNWTLGYPFALGLMTAVASGLIYFFWRKGWLT